MHGVLRAQPVARRSTTSRSDATERSLAPTGGGSQDSDSGLIAIQFPRGSAFGTHLARLSAMKTKHYLSPVGVLAVLLVSACDRGPELEPAKSANEVEALDDAVEARQQGVHVIAQADEWPGEADILEEVTPLRVIVRNNSDEPLQIRYSSFKLAGPEGSDRSAIPPRNVSGIVERDIDRVQPGFGYNSFYVAPYYGGYYDIPAYAGPFYYDSVYYDTHYTYWDSYTTLPTQEMLSRALPEGVLQPGGNVDGYLYFPKVQADEGETVTLRADFTAAESDRAVASLQMPFVVD